ncbi:hypothetical protein WA026_002674 [Henosepilachna vigintioctopunctata]|uniref:Uncharacterized protein n=1 Tax=Henosepilachna vigintioctopunctata TaxID=420089 RepID=A0AAW1U0W1_9CUCU
MQSLPQHPLQAFIAPNAAMRSFLPSVHCNTEHHRAGRQTTPCPSLLDARKPAIPSVRCKITVVREQHTLGQPVLDAVISPHDGRKKGLTVVQALLQHPLQVFPALTSTARIYVPSFHCNTDTLPN